MRPRRVSPTLAGTNGFSVKSCPFGAFPPITFT